MCLRISGDSLDVGPYRLLIADVYNILAEIERDDGNLAAAIKAARGGISAGLVRRAIHAYRRALEKAQRLLDKFGARYPEPPSRDTSFDEILDQIPSPPAAESTDRRRSKHTT